MKDVEEIVSRLSDLYKDACIVCLPSLPLHMLRKPPTKPTPDSSGSTQVLILNNPNNRALVAESYSRFLASTYKLTKETFQAAYLHSFAVEDFGHELQENKALQCTSCDNFLRDPSLDLFGPFGRLLQGICTTAVLGISSVPLPSVDQLKLTSTYPTLTGLADLDNRSTRYDQIVLVGDVALYSPLNSGYLEGKNIAILPRMAFSSEAFGLFTAKASRYPPNTLFVFFVDPLVFLEKVTYPHCRVSSCSNVISRYNFGTESFSTDSAIQQWINEKLVNVMSLLKGFKKSLPNQSSVIIGPMSPQRVLLQESDPSFFNHNLLHIQYYFETKPIAFGPEKIWNNLYRVCSSEMKSAKYSLDLGLENLIKSIDYSCEDMLSCVDNPRLYGEAFPEKIAWSDYIKNIIAQVEKLVFPTTGISADDLQLVDGIKAAAELSTSGRSRSKCSSVASNSCTAAQEVDTSPCRLVVMGTSSLAMSCSLLIASSHPATRLPKVFVQRIVFFFNPVGEIVENEDLGE